MIYILVGLVILACILLFVRHINKLQREIAELDRKILFSSGKLEGLQESTVYYENMINLNAKRVQIDLILELLQEGLLTESNELHEVVQNKLDSWREDNASIQE